MNACEASGAFLYQRHWPEKTLLYQLVSKYYPAFRQQLAEEGRVLPGYVQREFGGYLKCGRLEHGFLRVRCESCHEERLVAFSCTNSRRFRRAPRFTPGILPYALRARLRRFKIAPGDFVCPSCGARRMVESAALLVDEVLPHEPIRQWVLSFLFLLRFLFASRPVITGQVLGIVNRVISMHLVKKAGYSKKMARTGAVTLIQRFGSALNLNMHA